MIKRAPIELPPEVARRFTADMKAYQLRTIRLSATRSQHVKSGLSMNTAGRAISNCG
jgi:hypothetical protein